MSRNVISVASISQKQDTNMKINLECSCGNKDQLRTIDEGVYNKPETKGKPIYIFIERMDEIKIKCLACNKESVL